MPTTSPTVTYIADYGADDAAAAITDIAASHDYAHADAHEAADPASAAAANAKAAELRVIRAEVHQLDHHADAMVMYLSALEWLG